MLLDSLSERVISWGTEVRAHLVAKVAEVQSLRDRVESDRVRFRHDDAYKLQTMQYLRKYEAELQKKETQLTELRRELQRKT